MGKPISSKGIFPFGSTGILIDGAKIDGTTYVQTLYIHKQRSDEYYDLMDSTGNIFQFIRIGYTNSYGMPLNYFNRNDDLVMSIPNNTFYIKVQDRSREIYSFARLYQSNKCITFDGNYIFKDYEQSDKTISGIILNPSVITLEVGRSFTFKADFIPESYPNISGLWSMNNMTNTDPSIPGVPFNISVSNDNVATITAYAAGSGVVTFMPTDDSTKFASSLINVVHTNIPVKSIYAKNAESSNVYRYGEVFKLQIVTVPYDAPLSQPLTLDIKCMNSRYIEIDNLVELVSVSSDNKTYSFKANQPSFPNGRPEGYESESYNISPRITFTLDDPKFSVTNADISVREEGSRYANYESTFYSPSLRYEVPRFLGTNQTYQCFTYISGPETEIYDIKSSNPSIATMTKDGMVTTYNKEGRVDFTYDYKNQVGKRAEYKMSYYTQVSNDIYDYAEVTPVINIVRPGDKIDFNIDVYKNNAKVTPAKPITFYGNSSTRNYSWSKTGSLEIFPTAEDSNLSNTGNSSLPSNSVTTSFSRDFPITSPILVGISKTLTDIPLTGFKNDTPITGNEMMIKLAGGNSITYYNTIRVSTLPAFCTENEFEILDYDKSVAYLYDEERLLKQAITSHSLYIPVIPVSRGETEITIQSKVHPDIKISFIVIVY